MFRIKPVLNAVYLSAKESLRRVKFLHILSQNIRRLVVSGEEISELSRLINEDRMVVLEPYSQVKHNETGRLTVHETVKEYLQNYRTVRLRKITANRLAVPKGAVLLRCPLALLVIPSEREEYLKAVGAKTRNMIRKAEKQGYEFREFEWNNHLDQIYSINTSKKVRSAGEMSGWYTKPVKPRHHSGDYQHYNKYYGVLKDERLFAYLHLVLCGDFAFFKHFIGHADHLRNGIMNYLLFCTVREYIGDSHITRLSYGTFLAGSKGSVSDFKRHAGFQGYAGFINLEEDQVLLRYSRRVRAVGLMSV